MVEIHEGMYTHILWGKQPGTPNGKICISHPEHTDRDKINKRGYKNKKPWGQPFGHSKEPLLHRFGADAKPRLGSPALPQEEPRRPIARLPIYPLKGRVGGGGRV